MRKTDLTANMQMMVKIIDQQRTHLTRSDGVKVSHFGLSHLLNVDIVTVMSVLEKDVRHNLHDFHG